MQDEKPLDLPQIPETGPRKEPQKVEEFGGKHIPVGTLDEFALAVYGQPLEKKPGTMPIFHKGLLLGIEKFKTAGGKFYRLIWVGRGKAWLAAENTEAFRTKVLAWAAGYMLAAETGAYFDEGTR